MCPLPLPIFQPSSLFVSSIALPFTLHTVYSLSIDICHLSPEVVDSSYLGFKAILRELSFGYKPVIVISWGSQGEAEGFQVPSLPGSTVTSNLDRIDT